MLTFLAIPFFSCPHPNSRSNSSAVSDQVKVAVLANVKLLARTSRRVNAKSSFAFETMKFYSDMYMRRAFQMSVLSIRPDVVLFLGDQFDGGAELNDQEWQDSVTRFKHIFDLNNERRKANTSVHYSPGNLDIHYLNSYIQYPQVNSRYEKEFGTKNYIFSAGTVEFVVVDSQTLDGPSKGTPTLSSWEFLRNMSNVNSLKSRVLLTPNPLFHATPPCGRSYSFSVVNQTDSQAGVGHGVSDQNNLRPETSSQLLSLTKPMLVLSAHDHDQCTVNHSMPYGLVQEHTLGSFNWIHGNHNPSFMLLTVSDNHNSTDLVSTNLCFLPMQTHIYIWYLCQFIATLILLATWPTNGFGCFDRFCEFVSAVKSFGRSLLVHSKEKVDDENCEYEMIWDAEGSMHLVKKATSHVTNAKLDLGSTIRGNATMRQSARKNTVHDEEQMLSLDMSSVKVPRVNKSNAAKLISRLFRVIRLLSIIAALNLPIYMMLLFKDWVI